MKKAIKIVLVVILVAYAVVATIAATSFRSEAEAESEAWDKLNALYLEVRDQRDELLAEKTDSVIGSVDMVALEAWANCISEKNYVCEIDDETAMVVVYAEGRSKDEFARDLAEYGPMFTTALKTGEYLRGIILIMSDDDYVWAGTTVAADGESWQFANESWWN